MLFREFAIDPSQLKDLKDLRLLESRFGYEKGCLISAFPSDWLRHAIVGLQSNQQNTQIDKLTELLRLIIQKSLHRYGRNFSGANWIDAAVRTNAAKPFHRIIESSKPKLPIHYTNLYELADDDFHLISYCNRTATQISTVSEELLVDAEKVTIIDAYAIPSNVGYIKTLTQIASKTKKSKVEFIVFSEENQQSDSIEDRKKHLISLVKQLPQNINLTWCFISDNGTGYIHPRALFTAKGGIIFDRGFKEPSDIDQKSAPNLISILTKTQLEKFTLDYNHNQINEPLEINHLWHSA